MDENASPAERMAELPPETRKFLAELDPADIVTLRDGLDLVRSMMRVGRFSKWVIVSIVGLFLGGVMVVDGIAKIAAWLHGK